jgi:hypothetical protein
MQTPPDGADSDASDPRDLDPEEVLERDAYVLLDPGYLRGLHARLGESLSRTEATLALMRMGLLHGLQDAMRARNGGSEASAEPCCVPPLTMQYRVQSDGVGSLEVRGHWPDRPEASARLEASGCDASGCCALSAGYTSGWLSGMLDMDLVAAEESCGANGDERCRFVAREAAAWRADGGEVATWLDGLPLDAYRALVRAREARRSLDARPANDAAGLGIDRTSACVHIWGPVMVLPFGGAEEGMRTLDLLGRDPEAREVSVVVVDLGDAIIDPAFGAMALELILRTADSWGAETLFAEASPLSESVLAELDHPPLLVFKELDRAIAAAFQIARVQRRPA